MPQDPLDREASRATREFTDRDSFKEAFDAAFDALDPARNAVLMFYGVGGIGKSALLDHLRDRALRRGPDVAVARLDFTERENRLPTRALAQARSQFQAHGVPFPSFDVAYAHYWRLAYPDQPLADAAIPLLDDGEMVAGVLEAVREVPGLDLVSKIPRALGRLGQVARDWWAKRGSEELRVLIGETDAGRVADRLRVFWANDVLDWLAESPDHRRAVLFLDTLEALGETESTGVRGAAPDDWVRHWVGRLPGVLVVVAGRQKLRWHERDATWGEMIEQHLVGGLAPEDADRFLTTSGVTEPDVRAAIVERSEGVPLYLDLAVDTYEAIRAGEGRPPRPDEFDANLGALLDRFLHYLSDAQRATITVLSVPSTFDLDRFRDLVATFSTGVPATADGLAVLRPFSFVEEVEPRRYALHDLVREALAVRDARDPDRAAEREAIHGHLLAQAEAVLDQIDVRAVTEADERALREATEHQRALLPVKEWAAWYTEAERPFFKAARWTVITPLHANVLDQMDQELGLGHAHTFHHASNLGYLLQAQGDLKGAEPLFRRALRGYEALLGPDHPETLRSKNNLAGLLDSRGDLAGAELLYRQTLSRCEDALGVDHPDTLRLVNNLGYLLQARGDLAGAEPLYRRALSGYEATLGPDHPETLTAVNNLGDLLQARGDLAGAEPLYRRALSGLDATLGPDHPSTLTAVTNLGNLLQARGDLAGAEPILRRALAEREATLGPDHPDTLTSLSSLGALLSSKGDLEGAETLYRQSLARREEALGAGHPHTLRSANNLAYVLQERGDLDEAERLYRRALAGQEATLGPDHPETLISVNNLGYLLEERGDLAGAESLYKRALGGQEATLGPDHPRTLKWMSNLAALLEKRGALAEAEELYRRALAAQEATLGPNHPATLRSVNKLGSVLESKGDHTEVEMFWRRVLTEREASLSPDHPMTLLSVVKLAVLLISREDLAGAEPLYRRAAEIAERTQGPDHPHTKLYRDHLRLLLEALASGEGQEDN